MKSYGVTIQIYLSYFICHTIIITKYIGKAIVARRPKKTIGAYDRLRKASSSYGLELFNIS